jgi:hypothetical protein
MNSRRWTSSVRRIASGAVATALLLATLGACSVAAEDEETSDATSGAATGAIAAWSKEQPKVLWGIEGASGLSKQCFEIQVTKTDDGLSKPVRSWNESDFTAPSQGDQVVILDPQPNMFNSRHWTNWLGGTWTHEAWFVGNETKPGLRISLLRSRQNRASTLKKCPSATKEACLERRTFLRVVSRRRTTIKTEKLSLVSTTSRGGAACDRPLRAV